MKNTIVRKSIAILLSALMAFGIIGTGVISFTARAEGTAVIHIVPGEGVETLLVKNVGTGEYIDDGGTVPYGTHLRAYPTIHTAYNALEGGRVPVYYNDFESTDLLSVNEDDITVTTADLPKKDLKFTFNPNGGQLVGDETFRYAQWNEPLPDAIHAVRPGYKFKGYTLTYYQAYDENYNPLLTAYPLMGNFGTAEAQWERISYNITFDPSIGALDGFWVMIFDGSGASYPDEVNEPVSFTYNIEDTKVVPEVIAPAGYTFTGWVVSGEDHNWGETVGQRESLTGKLGDVELTAQFRPNTNTRYRVRYYVMDEEGNYPSSPTSTVTRYGTTDTNAIAETDPPAGYEVDTSRSVLTLPIRGDGLTILKVYYAIKKYTVTFVDADGNVLQESDWRSGETPVCSAEIPEKAYDDDYHYSAGWDKEIVPAEEDAVYTLVYTPEAHNYVGYTQISPATCVADALEQGACACGKTNVREAEGTLDPDAHSYVNYSYNGDATFADDGTESAVCEYDASHAADTRAAQNTAFRNRYSAGASDAVAAAEAIINDAAEDAEKYAPEYIEALSGALDEILTTDANYLTAEQAAAIEQALTDLVNSAGSHMYYDRTVQFFNISRMHYVIEEGDGFAVYNSGAVKWFSSKELKFHVYTYSNFAYDSYKVYINGEEATPDANGVYTIPAGSHADVVSIIGATEKLDSTRCAYCGEIHDGTFWGRLVAFIHLILAFFMQLFNR